MHGTAADRRSKSPFDFSLLDGFDQTAFMKNSKELLKDNPYYPKGFCNGLTFLWLYSKALKQESTFFQLYTAFLLLEPQTLVSASMLSFIELVKHL
jgi:hypothetical protein